MFVRSEWMEAISSLFRRLYGWSRRASIFQPHVRHRVDEYFEELDWARRDRIRRAGGVLPRPFSGPTPRERKIWFRCFLRP
jgi:hypothetical protein